jgi:deoxyribodipyrimidine photo-lyase
MEQAAPIEQAGAMEQAAPMERAGAIFSPGAHVMSLPLPNSAPVEGFPAGEAEAQRRLSAFLEADVYRYATARNRLAGEAGSQLSPYLRFGMLSPSQATAGAYAAMGAAETAEARQSAEIWLNELIWREFYIHLLDHFPEARRGNFRPRPVRWRNDPAHFAAWCEGRTGYPVVDAAMRQLAQTGWMPNRARMVTASFLTKDLLIDWRWGERFFMEHLVDGDPASNNGGWQWTAGTGADAAPYFRIFNPVSQSLKYDPQGAYLRRWLPELAGLPLDELHQPWKPPTPPEAYPAPVVDHAQARRLALAAYRPPA